MATPSNNSTTLNEQLYLLLRLGKEIAANPNLDDLLQVLGDTGRDIVNADRCSIFIYDKEKNELWTKIAHGVDEIRVPADVGVAGKAALSQEVQIVVDAYNDFRFFKDIDKNTGYVTKNIVAVPLLNHKHETVGVFQALNKKDGVFSNVDAELLILISNYASVALENALLYEKLKNSQTKIINKLSEAAEFRDDDTSAHTKRVGLFCKIIAQEMKLDNEFCNLIELTAPMHDIGKIGVPDHILLKPGKLTDEEFSIMKNHAMIGYEILKDEEDPILTMAANIARDHHERYTGGGYPRGIAKEAITLEGRITAVVDVFDALTSSRPYKEAWSIEKSIALIKEERGRQFDPKVVDALLARLDLIIEVKEKFSN